MKSRKPTYDRDIQPVPFPHKNRSSISTKGTGLTKRREDKLNKQNILQITQPLDSNMKSFSSKEFILSKDGSSKNSRSSLNIIDTNQNMMFTQNSKQIPKRIDQDQEAFDRRLSLKCTNNYSQQLQSQKSQRLSMAPLRRDSLYSNNNGGYPNFMDERESMCSVYQNSVMGSESKMRNQMRKQTIITNLVNKLEHQEDLRSIIQSKLKNNNSSQCLSKDRRNQSYITDFAEDNNSVMASKLKQCQSEIKYFKSIIKQMSDKIMEMNEDKNFSKKKSRMTEVDDCEIKKQNKEDIFSIIKKIGSKCENCQKNQILKQKVTKQIATQTTQELQSNTHSNKTNESFDFLDNLQKTLKVLDNKKH